MHSDVKIDYTVYLSLSFSFDQRFNAHDEIIYAAMPGIYLEGISVRSPGIRSKYAHRLTTPGITR